MNIKSAIKCSSCGRITEYSLFKLPLTVKCQFCGKVLAVFSKHGILYVLTNVSIPGLLKIGYTERDLDSRVEELSSSTGVPTPFVVAAKFEVENPEEVEKRIHDKLRHCRENSGREFFRISLEDAISIISFDLGINVENKSAKPDFDKQAYAPMSDSSKKTGLDTNDLIEDSRIIRAWQELTLWFGIIFFCQIMALWLSQKLDAELWGYTAIVGIIVVICSIITFTLMKRRRRIANSGRCK